MNVFFNGIGGYFISLVLICVYRTELFKHKFTRFLEVTFFLLLLLFSNPPWNFLIFYINYSLALSLSFSLLSGNSIYWINITRFNSCLFGRKFISWLFVLTLVIMVCTVGSVLCATAVRNFEKLLWQIYFLIDDFFAL